MDVVLVILQAAVVALIPVIYETAYRNGQRPERSLAASTVTSALGITASPVSAAMVAYLELASPFSLVQILAITIPAAIVACLATSFVQQRIGKELLDDPAFLKRVDEGQVDMPAVLIAQQEARAQAVAGGASHGKAARQAKKASAAVPSDAQKILHEVPPGGAISAWIFVVAIVAVVLMGLFSGLRPAFPNADGELVPIGMSPVIEMFMFTAALVIILVRKVPPADIMKQPLLSSGIVAAIALFGIAWMADTFISANKTTIVDPLGGALSRPFRSSSRSPSSSWPASRRVSPRRPTRSCRSPSAPACRSPSSPRCGPHSSGSGSFPRTVRRSPPSRPTAPARPG